MGRQKKITDFYLQNAAASLELPPGMCPDGTLRMVQLRNPWGRQEWNGAFSAKSDLWTNRLKQELGHTSANDGVFWMPFADFISHFSSVDVLKNHENWWSKVR